MARILFVVSVAREARAIAGASAGTHVVVGGIGRTNAAAAVTEAILTDGPFDAVMSVGIAGALPAVDANRAAGAPLAIGDLVVASACVYAEEGLITAAGFQDMVAMGFALGDFEGNAVPVDPRLRDAAAQAIDGRIAVAPIATVATCSGTDEASLGVARRTGAVAEAMEGAAAVHAARRLGVRAIEVRAISNSTGERAEQQWDIERGLAALAQHVPSVIRSISELLDA